MNDASSQSSGEDSPQQLLGSNLLFQRSNLSLMEEMVALANDSITSTSSITNDSSYTPYTQRPETYIVPVVFLFIFVSGVIGNVTLICVLVREELIKTPSYLYILNLSLGDLAVILGTVPFVATIYTFESWPYGEFVCKLSEFVRDVSIGVSVLTLSAMSLDRYRAAFSQVMRPSGLGRGGATISALTILRSPTGLSMVSIWLVSIAFAAPTAYFSFVLEWKLNEQKTVFICYPFPTELGPLYPKSVVLIKCILYYIVPLLIIACCYVSIALHLIAKAKASEKSSNQASKTPAANAAGFKRSRKRSQSRARLILLFVLIFMVCFLPHHLFMIWFYFHPRSQDLYNDFWHCWRIVAFCLTFLNSCLNPITLYLTSDQFKDYFNKYLLNCRAKNSHVKPNLSIEMSESNINVAAQLQVSTANCSTQNVSL